MYVLCVSGYEPGYTGSMAEEGSVCELEGFQIQLASLRGRFASDAPRTDSEEFCEEFGKLVQEYISCWQLPLPRLKVLEVALRCFTHCSALFSSSCDHILHTLSSLALSVFELLLFFDQRDFHQDPLKQFIITFQECHSVLSSHQNVHLLQVGQHIQAGGPWADLTLQAVLAESSLPQDGADGFINSELPIFLELRVRYLLTCERVSEAVSLARCCARHPTAGQHLFFLQVYLTWLCKTSQHDHLHKEVADVRGKDAVHIICSLETEEKAELLLALNRAFLSQQLQRGDIYYLWELVFIWSKLHRRLKTSKQALLEESHQLMLSATNVNSIFPFIRVILQELGEDGIQFCVELCANALGSCLPCDVVTKSLIYKTIASLLPNDLEVCRACALLVFFLERTVESYKVVYVLYMHPDQEYHAEHSPIGNHTRFETLQVLKKGLYFDPEFWNLIALRTNCLNLMSEKLASGALAEIMDDDWISGYCAKESDVYSSRFPCQKSKEDAKKRHHKDERSDPASKRIKASQTCLTADHTVRKRGSRPVRGAPSQPLRRSFWQLDKLKDNCQYGNGEHRRTTRLSEKNPPKRRIRRPRWLLEDSGTLEGSKVHSSGGRHRLKSQHQTQLRSSKSVSVQDKSDVKHRTSLNSHIKVTGNEDENHKRISQDIVEPASPPHVVLELSLPDNELLGTFIEETCNRQRACPQMLLYKPMVKLPPTTQPMRSAHRNEVIIRARDVGTFVQQLHCYSRRQKGKGVMPTMRSSVSTITRSSVQGCMPAPTMMSECLTEEEPVTSNQSAVEDSFKAASPGDVSDEPSFEVTVASPAQIEAEEGDFQILDEVTGEFHTVTAKPASASQKPAVAQPQIPQALTSGVAQTAAAIVETPETPAATQLSTTKAEDDTPSLTPEAVHRNCLSSFEREKEFTSLNSQSEAKNLLLCNNTIHHKEVPHVVAANLPEPSESHLLPCDGVRRDTSVTNTLATVKQESGTEIGSKDDMCDLTLVTEMVTKLMPDTLAVKLDREEDVTSEEMPKALESKDGAPRRKSPTHNSSATQQGPSTDAGVGVKWEEDGPRCFEDNGSDDEGQPETEESKLEYCCTFCQKTFKGHRVVVHAMFHYRKDECMFCGTLFKDDLLAMMHLSNHIEKLKKSKESPGQESQGSVVVQKTPKAKTQSASPAHYNDRLRNKSARCNESSTLPHPGSSQSRKLRSTSKSAAKQKIKDKQKHSAIQTSHKVNGHIATSHTKEKKVRRDMLNLHSKQVEIPLQEKANSIEILQNGELKFSPCIKPMHLEKQLRCSTNDKMNETEGSQELQTVVGDVDKRRVYCPVDGCRWSTDPSKNRVALLYHALDDHHGNTGPLELAFKVGNSRCSVCMRVLWSFDHFLHHVERHRVTPRHPCLHQGCTARFKTGIEMRRHTRKHSPLQAPCCLPGCSQLFICLWALNLHEREHYATKPPKPVKKTSGQSSGKSSKDQADEGEESDKVNRSVRATQNLRGHVASIPAKKRKKRDHFKDSNGEKYLSTKKDAQQPSVRRRKLRRRLRKALHSDAASGQVSTSSLLKSSCTAKRRLKRLQVKLRGKDPKRRARSSESAKRNKAASEKNSCTGQSGEAVNKSVDVKKDGSGAPALPATRTQTVAQAPTGAELKKEEDKMESGQEPMLACDSVSPVSVPIESVSTLTLADSLAEVRDAVNTNEDMVQNSGSDTLKTTELSSSQNGCTGTAPSIASKSKEPDVTEPVRTTSRREALDAQEGKATDLGDSLQEEATPTMTSVSSASSMEETKKSYVHKSEEQCKKRPAEPHKTSKKHNSADIKEDNKTVKKKCKDAATKTSTCVFQEAENGPSTISVKNRENVTMVEKLPTKRKKGQVVSSQSKKTKVADDTTTGNKARDQEVPPAAGGAFQEILENKAAVEAETSVGDIRQPPVETPQSPAGATTEAVMVNGREPDSQGHKPPPGVASEDERAKPTHDEGPIGFRRLTYTRLPPTAYLDEKYTNMPKRRKEMSMFCSSSGSGKLNAPVSPAVSPPLRQRCPSCFVCFGSAEQLQSHIKLQTCSSLFGFDSDDEGGT